MITEGDIDKARAMARKWRGHPRFDEDDAFQAGIEALLQRNPEGEGLRVRVIQEGIMKASTENAFNVRIPAGSYHYLKKKGALPDAAFRVDATIDELDSWSRLSNDESGFGQVLDKVWYDETMATLRQVLSDRQLQVLELYLRGENKAPVWGQAERKVMQTVRRIMKERIRDEFAEA